MSIAKAGVRLAEWLYLVFGRLDSNLLTADLMQWNIRMSI